VNGDYIRAAPPDFRSSKPDHYQERKFGKRGLVLAPGGPVYKNAAVGALAWRKESTDASEGDMYLVHVDGNWRIMKVIEGWGGMEQARAFDYYMLNSGDGADAAVPPVAGAAAGDSVPGRLSAGAAPEWCTYWPGRAPLGHVYCGPIPFEGAGSYTSGILPAPSVEAVAEPTSALNTRGGGWFGDISTEQKIAQETGLSVDLLRKYNSRRLRFRSASTSAPARNLRGTYHGIEGDGVAASFTPVMTSIPIDGAPGATNTGSVGKKIDKMQIAIRNALLKRAAKKKSWKETVDNEGARIKEAWGEGDYDPSSSLKKIIDLCKKAQKVRDQNLIMGDADDDIAPDFTPGASSSRSNDGGPGGGPVPDSELIGNVVEAIPPFFDIETGAVEEVAAGRIVYAVKTVKNVGVGVLEGCAAIVKDLPGMVIDFAG